MNEPDYHTDFIELGRRFSNHIMVNGSTPHGVESYKEWLEETAGKRNVDWTLMWEYEIWFQITFRRREDMTAFRLKFGV
jgi:hypothetical protein